MASKEGNESWVTLALADAEALQAIFLAKSLKEVATTRKIWIVISQNVTERMRILLMDVFHGILQIPNQELCEVGFKEDACASVSKLWGWKLKQFKKCVFLSPHSLVRENCDGIFEYDELSALPDKKMPEWFKTDLFVYRPNCDSFEKLLGLALTFEQVNEAVLLNEFFNWKYLDEQLSKSILLDGDSNDPKRIAAKNSDIENLPINAIQDINDNTIAVVGMSCRFPGANSTAEYWELLAEGKEAIRKYPSDRPFTGPKEARGMQAGFLNLAVDEFDAKFFGISPREAVFVDPQQRLLLEVTWECLENAGINPQTLRDSDTGVYVGMWQHDYERIISGLNENDEGQETSDYLHRFLGNKPSATASRISFCLGLNGPAVAVESGCSSSLTGLHLACESLHSGETSLALVSGVNLILLPFDPFSGTVGDDKGVVLSKNYRCKTFDEDADGFVRAEACGVVALKRFEDARRDGDNILAIVRGTAINNDGCGTSFGTPNEKAQEKVYRAALKRAKMSSSEVSYVEAHGTGTVVGDPIEMYAVGQVYSEGRTEPLLVGSVKTNIGHCEAAAGIASLIKVILCIQNEAIPPHLNLKTLNPRIDLDSIPAKIPMVLTPWNVSTKIAAVSSFSMSATNAHAIIQEPPRKVRLLKKDSTATEIFTLSAKSEEALLDLRKKYIAFLKSNGDIPLVDLAYAANTGRAHLQHRIAVVASSTSQLLFRLENQDLTQGKAPALVSKVAFLFTGQGSQYPGMTKGLCEAFPSFQRAMKICNHIFQKNLHMSLHDVLYKNDELLSQTLYCQPAIFCIEYCIVQLWSHYGIKPDCVLGHSVGEFAAAVASGLLALEDAMKLVIARSELINKLPVGSMLALRASEEETRRLVMQFSKCTKLYVDIAAINSSEEVVVSGNLKSVSEFQDFCSNSGVGFVNIPASHAFHSREMDAVLEDYFKIAQTVSTRKLNCTYVSGTLAKEMDITEFDSKYWQCHLRESVKFSEAIKVVWSECQILVEIGAQPVLLGIAMANLQDSSVGVFCPSQRRREETTLSFFNAMKKLYVSGVKFDWPSVYGIRQKSVTLPTYPFQRQKYWISDFKQEDVVSPLLHPLLGRKFHSPLPELIFHQTLRLKELSYFQDHEIVEYVVVPGAAFLETFMAAGCEILQSGARNMFSLTIENFVIEAVLPLEIQKCQIQTLVKTAKQESEKNELRYELTLSRKLEQHFDKWKLHASAQFKLSSRITEEGPLDVEAFKSTLELGQSPGIRYKNLHDAGIKLGPKFQSIVSVWYNSTDTLFQIQRPKSEQPEHYICHPIILDAMIQASGYTDYIFKYIEQVEDKNEIFLPIGIRKFIWLNKPLSNIMFAKSARDTGLVTLYNSNGERLAIMEGVEILRTNINTVTRAIRADSFETPDFIGEIWRPVVGKTNLRVNISKLSSPNFNSLAVKAARETTDKLDAQGIPIRQSQEYADTAMFFIFLIGIQECHWTWPNPGTLITCQDWKSFLPSSFNEGIIGIYMNELEVRGYLEYLETGTYRVLRILPSRVECDRTLDYYMETISHQSKNSSYSISGNQPVFERLRICFPDILRGKITPLTFLFPENETTPGAEYMYSKSPYYKQLNLLVLSHFEDTIIKFRDSQSKDGILRILEVGAGTGTTTDLCIPVLKRLNIPFHYTFTDISHLFLTRAKKNFGEGPEFSYKLFDVEKDPLTQGFSPEEYDLIIAAQVIHATVSILESLSNLKRVLRVGGSLILGETFYPRTLHLFIFGMLDGWWRFKDFRLNSKLTALLNEAQWETSLNEVGFDDIFCTTGVYSGVISARNTSADMRIACKVDKLTKKWLFIKDSSQVCHSTMKSFESYGREVIEVSETSSEYYSACLRTEVNNLEGVIFFFTKFSNTNVIKIQNEIVSTLLNFLKSYEIGIAQYKLQPKILVVTRGVYSIGDSAPGDSNGATAWGMMKTFFNENRNSRICLIDLDPDLYSAETSQVFSQIWNADEELFVAFRQNTTFVLRCNFIEKQSLPIQLPNTDRFKIVSPESGAFNEIEVAPVWQMDLNDDDVEIEVRACALNFRDLFMVMKPEGFSPPGANSLEGISKESIGVDVSGVVVSIGSNVTRFQTGDEVFGIARNGGLGTHALAWEHALMKMPQYMTFVEASTIPCAFMTVLVSLVDVGKIREHDRVLIHAASGGVGLAAIQILKSVGCEIFATAGNRRKRAYLRNLGIKHVYHSRDATYGEGIERDTNGFGVTVVLNCLTAPNFKETSLKVCSYGARFIEIAKMNIWKPEEVAELRPDIKYTIIDLTIEESNEEGASESKAQLNDRITRVQKLVHERTFVAIPSVTFPLTSIRDAFYYFQKAKHIGKIVVQIPLRTVSKDRKLEHKHQIFNDKSSYMITGGLGGIGMEVVQWMRTVGAKTVILVGRSIPTGNVQRLIDDWNNQGNNVVIFQTDISEYDNCQRILDILKYLNMPELRGIFHAAGVISDGPISTQTEEQFQTVLRPKVYGAWFLHQLTLNYQLEFFVMFSSMAGVLGMIGQSSHCAANRFLDSLTHYRISMGLPGKTIDWGGWSDIGAAARIGFIAESFGGMRLFTPSQGISALEKIMISQNTQVGVSEITDQELLKSSFGQGHFLDEIITDASGGKKFEQFDYLIEEIKKTVSTQERTLKIQTYIEAVLKETLSLPQSEVLDIDQHFGDFGVDSLMGMELKNRLHPILDGKNLSISAMQENRTIQSLASHITFIMENERTNVSKGPV